MTEISYSFKNVCYIALGGLLAIGLILGSFAMCDTPRHREPFPRDLGKNVYQTIKVPDFTKTVCWKCHKDAQIIPRMPADKSI